jgi:hypothetical protein
VATGEYNEDEGESGTSAAAFIDPGTNAVIDTVSLPVDVGVPVVLDDAIFFPGMAGSIAVVVDRSTWAVTSTPDLGRPTGASQSGFDGTSMYIGTADHEDILKVDANTYAVTDTIKPLHANTVSSTTARSGPPTAAGSMSFNGSPSRTRGCERTSIRRGPNRRNG